MITNVMETRLQRYAKYRDGIRRLPEDVFTDEGKFAQKLTPEELRSLAFLGRPSSAISVASKEKPNVEFTPDEGEASPYSLYLAKKRLGWILKGILFLLVVAGFVLFFFFFVNQQ